ncbi:MAG: HAD family hydrolase, partial [Candidatus Glassbacteria bacterium]|nr:HAD family hydrolase [Candidatus Glassbacteria bacterium]
MTGTSQRLYLFDIDGTMATTNRAGSRSFMRSCRHTLGLVGEVDGVLMAGKLDRVIFQEIAERFRPDLDDGELNERWLHFRQGYLEHLRAESEDPRGWTLLPGVKPLLERCSRLGSMALLTGNVREGAYIKL